MIAPSHALVTRDLFHRMDFVAFGQVALWGRVEAHRHGYRAEYAYPAWIRILDGPEDLCRELEALYKVPVLPCGFRKTIRDRLALLLPDPAAADRLVAAAITYHVRRNRRVPMGLVNGEGRWRPSLGTRLEHCARCHSGTESSHLPSRLNHYRSVEHIASLYRVPAAAVETATRILEEIDGGLMQGPL